MATRYRLGILLATTGWVAFATVQSRPAAQERIGTVRQPLVNGGLVHPAVREELGLLTLAKSGGTCSASLVDNSWAVTAAHCVEVENPAMPGTVVQEAPANVTLTANWRTVQQQTAVRIERFRPLDVAIVQVAAPFRVGGSTTGYVRRLWSDGDFQDLRQHAIEIFGRGINQFASGSGSSAMPSQSDGEYRFGRAVIRGADADSYSFTNEAGQSVAGGDSGGPSFVSYAAVGQRNLAGVHSSCGVECVPGRVCGNWPGPGPEPASYSPWRWVAATTTCSDAPIGPVADRIWRIVVGSRPTDPPPPPPDPPFSSPDFRPHAAPSVVYGVGRDGALKWYRHDGAQNGQPTWLGPRDVAAGWGEFRQVVAGGGSAIYSLDGNGSLRWYVHRGSWEGRGVDTPGAWQGNRIVGSGWDAFQHVFSGGNGILYGIAPDGNLHWFRHSDYSQQQTSSAPAAAIVHAGGQLQPAPNRRDTSRYAVRTRVPTLNGGAGPKAVGTGWQGFTHVFSTGEGIIYAVSPDGALRWYKHNGYMDGRGLESPNAWEGPRVIGSGWNTFSRIFSPGGGVIYAVTDDGTLMWFRHDEYRNPRAVVAPNRPSGGPRGGIQLEGIRRPGRDSTYTQARAILMGGEGPRPVGSGWQNFVQVFALLPGAPADVIR